MTKTNERKIIYTGQVDYFFDCEFANGGNEPFYPIPNERNHNLNKGYFEKTGEIENVISCGRLAEYQYYNMDQVVANTLKVFEKLK